MKRLTPAKVTLLMFVVVGGLIAAYVAKGLFASTAKPPEIKTRNVPMALSDIAPGTVITEDHIGSGPVVESDLTRDVLLMSRVLVGRIAKEKIKAAQPIRSSQLYEIGSRPPLPLTQEMRAVTINIGSATALVDGLIKPGEFVDMHFTPSGMDTDPRAGGGLTMTLLKGVKILAINRLTMQGNIESDRNTVTLELTQDQANVVLLASNKGSLNLSYNPNGQGDGAIALKGKDRATLEEILGLEPAKKPADPFVSQVYRGNSRQEVKFEGHNKVIEQNGVLPVIPQQQQPAQPVPQPRYDVVPPTPQNPAVPMPNTLTPNTRTDMPPQPTTGRGPTA